MLFRSVEREIAPLGDSRSDASSSDGSEGGRAGESRWVAGSFLVATVGLWWWEVRLRGGLPADAAGPLASPEVLATRWLAHLALLWFLFAATWIDLRYRVIPDWITVTGVLVGLVAVWACPSILLPVTTPVAREFAVPLEVPDVLGWAGPLFAPRPPGAGGSPGMLVAAAAMFVLWWWIGTGEDRLAAAGESSRDGDGAANAATTVDDPDGRPAGRGETLRWAILGAGLAAIAAAWWLGGARAEGLFSAIVGMTVAGGLVWATRAGASAAMGMEAMGLGDATLMAMVGAWLGWQAGVLACFLGVFVGLVHGVLLLAMGRGNELPFGPGLCAGSVITVAAWRAVWHAAADSFEEPWRIAAVVVAVVGGTALTLWIWGAIPRSARRSLLVAALVLLALLAVWMSATGV